MSKFVHLHVHTQYSLLEGAIHVENLFERITKLQMKAVAITDTNNLFGAIDFYKKAKKKNRPNAIFDSIRKPTPPNSFRMKNKKKSKNLIEKVSSEIKLKSEYARKKALSLKEY